MSPPADQASVPRSAWTGLAAVVAFQISLGLYAASLNELFYARFGPFYDSLSYLNTIADMRTQARADGWFSALRGAVSHSTVVLPWVIFAPFARLAGTTRTIGVWVQIVPATIMQLLLYTYWLRVRAATATEAFVFSAAFSSIAAAFFFNGGLADFRMDLLQYLLFTTMLAAYLIARKSASASLWALFGLTCGALCLGRATSPVYLVAIFAVVSTADVVAAGPSRRAIIKGWLVAGIVAVLTAGWFFIVAFDRLYYYYFVWNLDANARLPFAESARHLRIAFQHIGHPLFIALAAVGLATIFAAVRAAGLVVLRHVNWRPLWFSVVPLGFLVVSGAGLNPFVSIVGIAGVMLFLLDPLSGTRSPIHPILRSCVLAGVAGAAFVNAASGIANHSRTERVDSWIPRQDGMRSVNAAILDAARARGRGVYRYAVVHIGSLDLSVIFNSYVYDWRLATRRNREVESDGVVLAATRSGRAGATAVEWARRPGDTDDQKIAALVAEVSRDADFLVLALEDSNLPRHVYVTQFIPEINRQFRESGRWAAITGPIAVSPIERVVVMQNMQRRND